MINDNIINFIDDVYLDRDNVKKNILKYNHNNLFYLIHTRVLYLYFDYVKDIIIHKLYLNDNKHIENEFNIELTNDLINFYIPDILTLKECVLYDYNIDDNNLNIIFNKIKNYDNSK